MKPLLAFLAVGFALAVIWMTWMSAHPVSVAAAAPAEVDLGPLMARVAALEQQLKALVARENAEHAATPAAVERESLTAAPGEDVVASLRRLEAQIAELRVARDEERRDAAGRQGRPATPEAAAVTLDQWTQRARDLSASETERLAALRELRGKQRPDGTDARLAVLDDMIQLGQTSKDAATRADAWRQLSHVTDARLKQPLLDALAFDADRRVREEAAETVSDFLPDKQVEAALRQAAQNDASPEVRRQAASSLAGGH